MTTDTQTITSLKLMNDSPRMVEDIIDLIVAESIATLVETEDNYSHLHDLFLRPGEDIVENYTSSKYGIDLSTEYQSLHPLVEQVIDNIGANLFFMMWEMDEWSTLSEALRCFGHGVSFWDNWEYQDFGFNDMPKLKTTLESPHDTASTILDKITDYHPEYQPTGIEEENIDDGYFLIVTENQTGEIIYTRQLKGDDLLDCDSYLYEIEQATEMCFDYRSIAAGMGQYNIRIGFGSNPEDCCIWESKDYFMSEEEY